MQSIANCMTSYCIAINFEELKCMRYTVKDLLEFASIPSTKGISWLISLHNSNGVFIGTHFIQCKNLGIIKEGDGQTAILCHAHWHLHL